MNQIFVTVPIASYLASNLSTYMVMINFGKMIVPHNYVAIYESCAIH